MLSKKKYLEIIKSTTLTAIDMIFFFDNKILLGYRNNKPAKDYWFTPGCRTGKYETQQQGMNRVADSECGINLKDDKLIKNIQLLGVYDHIYDDNFDNDDFGTHYVVNSYLIELNYKPKLTLDNQHENFEWFDINDIIDNESVHKNVKIYIPGIKKKIIYKITPNKIREILGDEEISIGMRVWIESSHSNVPSEGIGGVIKLHRKYTGSDSGCGYDTRIDLDNGSDVDRSIFNNYWVRIYSY